ncbi:cytochrome-c peroxidase [Hymenobacter koreensis]|uniref:Cytochrome c peroxidase n=1 Tax=Hymenobacter koreensis TaxID=1084523 RepID=A0ABP8J4D6_9BACT
MKTRLFRLPALGQWVLLGLAAVLFSFTALRPAPTGQVKAYYTDHLTRLHEALTRFQADAYRANAAGLRTHFAACRAEYKHLEFAVEYYYPNAAQRLNGAALPEAEPSEPNEPTLPTGFQVLEEHVYADRLDRPTQDLIRLELDNLLFQVRYLQAQAPALVFIEAEAFDAVRLNLYRLAAKGVSGFDSPTARRSLPEAAVTLESARSVAACFNAPAPLMAELQRGMAFLRKPGVDFVSFDRAAFFVRHFNPILKELHQTQVQLNVPFGQVRRAVRPGTASFFAPDAFDATFFAPTDAAAPTAAVLALGEALFQEPTLSGRGGRSCANCHAPDKGYTDGLRVNRSLLADTEIERNTPTLLNAALQADQFYDGRVHTLEDQVHAVVSNKAEMGGKLSEVSAVLRKRGNYAKQFAQAFADEKSPVTERNIRRAVAAYVRSLVRLNSRFDGYLRGDTTLLTAQEVQGFNLFMGKAQCGTCHYMPLFNGAVPPLYEKTESEVLGVPATPDTLHPQLDKDQGKYLLHRIPHQQYAFKTPTVRNAALTAPYMHNGVYQTLEQVLDFYNKGGGAGLGLNVPTQTLPEDKLNLTAAEQQAIIAFIKSLNDAREVAY